MRKVKRCAIGLCLVVIGILIIVIASKTWYNYFNKAQDVVTMYEENKEKCKLLRQVAKEVIDEGHGIDESKIPAGKVEYRIYGTPDGNIVLYYHLEDIGMNSSYIYEATITLSKEYAILSEEYSQEIGTFEEYKQNHEFANRLVSSAFGIVIMLFVYFLPIYIALVILSIKKKKRKR